MRRVCIVVAVVIVAVVGIPLSYIVVRERRFIENRRLGAEVAAGLRQEISNDRRFTDVLITGYNVHGGFVHVRDYFYVSGFVSSTNDLLELQRVVRAANPPGHLDFTTVHVDPYRQQRTKQ